MVALGGCASSKWMHPTSGRDHQACLGLALPVAKAGAPPVGLAMELTGCCLVGLGAHTAEVTLRAGLNQAMHAMMHAYARLHAHQQQHWWVSCMAAAFGSSCARTSAQQCESACQALFHARVRAPQLESSTCSRQSRNCGHLPQRPASCAPRPPPCASCAPPPQPPASCAGEGAQGAASGRRACVPSL